jgi:hypothetical protein
MARDCVLTEILAIRMQKENTATAIARFSISEENPMASNDNENSKKDANSGILLLNLDTSQPDMGSPTSELIGITRSKFPNSASLKSKLVLMDGIRDAQEAKPKPSRKK